MVSSLLFCLGLLGHWQGRACSLLRLPGTLGWFVVLPGWPVAHGHGISATPGEAARRTTVGRAVIFVPHTVLKHSAYIDFHVIKLMKKTG